MKLNTIITFFVALSSFQLIAQLTWKDYNLNDSVSYCETFSYSPVDSNGYLQKGKMNRDYDTFHRFNKDGKLIEEGVYDIDDQDFYSKSYKSSETAIKSSSVSNSELSENNLKLERIQFYPLRMIFQSVIDNAPNGAEIDISYNHDSTMVIESIREPNDSKVQMMLKYIFDDQDQIIESIGIDDRGDVQSRMKHTYHNSELTETKSYRYEKFRSWERNEFDNNGKMTLSEKLNEDGTIKYRWTYKYDSFGNEIESTVTTSEGNHTNLKEFDEMHNPIKIINISPDEEPKVTIYSYEYDQNKNWIVRKIWKNGIQNKIQERIVIYF
jgi:hypothetical protein